MTDLATALMEQVLTKMTVISEQQARSYDGVSVSGGDKHAGVAPLTEQPMRDYWQERFNAAEDPHARRVVVLEAVDALKVARRTAVPEGQEPTFGSPQWKRYVFESKEDAGVLATRFHCTRRWINMVRQAEGVLTQQRADVEAALDIARQEKSA